MLTASRRGLVRELESVPRPWLSLWSLASAAGVADGPPDEHRVLAGSLPG